MVTTILPVESTVVPTAGRNLLGLPGEVDVVLLWGWRLKSLMSTSTTDCWLDVLKNVKLTCSYTAVILFDRLVCHARDRFPVKVRRGCEGQAEVPCSTGVA